MKTKKTWVVEFESSAVEAKFIKLFKSGLITKDDNKVILKWINIIESEGLKTIKETPLWHDHALDGQWQGFSFSGRIIYKVVDHKLLVSVVRVTHNHNYKR